MSSTSLALIALAAVMHATWNLAAKKAQGGQPFLGLCSVIMTFAYALPVAWVVREHGLPTRGAAWLALFASGAIHLAYFSILQRGYREADLSVVYPVARGTGPLISIALAVTILGERPSAQAYVGALVVVLGVFLLAGGASLLHAHDGRARAGLVWGSYTGLSIALYTVVDGYSVRSLQLSPLLVDYLGHLMRIAWVAPAALRNRATFVAEARSTLRYALVVGTLGPLSYLLVLTAMKDSPVSYVAPARELSLLVGAFFGARLLAEGELRRRLLCAGVIAMGVLLIALA